MTRRGHGGLLLAVLAGNWQKGSWSREVALASAHAEGQVPSHPKTDGSSTADITAEEGAWTVTIRPVAPTLALAQRRAVYRRTRTLVA